MKIKKKEWKEREAEFDKLMNKNSVSLKNGYGMDKWNRIIKEIKNET